MFLWRLTWAVGVFIAYMAHETVSIGLTKD
jgi:hypothetical protein